MDNNTAGNHSELKVAADLSKLGNVSIPMGEPAYDLVFDYDKLYRVQVKTAQRTGQRNDAHSVHLKRGNNARPYEQDDFDILAVTTVEHDEIAYWPWTPETHRQTLTVWFDKTEDDFRPCNRDMANIAELLTVENITETFK